MGSCSVALCAAVRFASTINNVPPTAAPIRTVQGWNHRKRRPEQQCSRTKFVEVVYGNAIAVSVTLTGDGIQYRVRFLVSIVPPLVLTSGSMLN